MIIRPTPWFMAPAGSTGPEITVGVGTGEYEGLFGYLADEIAIFSGSSSGFGSITNPELVYGLVWAGDASSEFIQFIYSRTNAKRFVFPDFFNNYFDTNEFLDLSDTFGELAPIYASNNPYYMGAGLPTTVGAKVRYIVTDSP